MCNSFLAACKLLFSLVKLAESQGFEPWEGINLRWFSSLTKS